jgi:nicotinamide-nucleotide amidase
MINLEEMVVRKLRTTQHVLCTVESCTGGLVSSLMTDVSGASEVFWGATVVYDNTAKEIFGLDPEILRNYGAVSSQVAHQLAELGLVKMQALLNQKPSPSLLKPRGYVCLSTTGLAGPLGGVQGKPVGLCFIGLAISGKKTSVTEFHASENLDRVCMKKQFAQKALELIRASF